MSTAVATSLWKIEDELIALLDSVAACDEDLIPELQEKVASYLGAEATKIDHVAHVLQALEWEQRCAADEICRLQERKKAAAAAQERLEQYVCRCITARGVKALKGATNTLSVRPSDAVVIQDPEAVPSLWKTATVKMPLTIWRETFEPFGFNDVTATVEISKAAIKKDLKAGVCIPGADLEYRSNLVKK